MANVATLTAKMAFDIGDYLSKSAKVQSDLKGIGDTTKSLGSAFSTAAAGGMAFAAANQALTMGLGAVSSAANLAYDALKRGVALSAEYEQSKIGFGTLLGSDAAAGDLMKELDTFALKTPFDSAFARTAANMLLVSGTAKKDLIPTMNLIGDIAQGNGEKFSAISTAYAQTLTAGKLTGTDSLQYLNAGIPIYDALAGSMKKTKAEILSMREKGLVSSADVRNALIDLGDTKFNNGMQRQTDSLSGQFSMLQENVDMSMRKIADSFADSMKDMLKHANNFAEEFNRSGVPEIIKGLNVVKVGAEQAAIRASSVWDSAPLQMFSNHSEMAARWMGMKDPERFNYSRELNLQGQENVRGRRLDEELRKVKPQEKKLEKNTSPEFWRKVFQPLDYGSAMARIAGRDAWGRGRDFLNPLERAAGGIGDRFRIGDSPLAKERSPQGALVAGSSEAMSAIIKNMFADKEKDVAKRSLEELKSITKAAEKTAGAIGDALKGIGSTVIASFSG